MRVLTFLSIGIVILVLVSMFINRAPTTDNKNVPTETEHPLLSLITSEIVMDGDKTLPADHYIGDVKAPIVMIEYASFTCPHCVAFNKNILPLIKEKYIDTGKVLFIYRDFPLDAMAMKASMLANCYASKQYFQKSPQLPRDYFYMNKALSHSIVEWSSKKDDQGLREIAKIAQIDTEEFDACMNDKKIQTQVINSKLKAVRELGLDASPVFFINGKKYEGRLTIENFSQYFDEILSNHQG